MSLTDSIAQAIAQMEGFHTPGTIAQRNNNPGNIRSGSSYRTFATPEEGWQALYAQVELNISRGLSLQEFFGGKPGVYPGYAPAADANDPRGYAQYVAGQVGISPTVPLNSIGDTSPPHKPPRTHPQGG